MRKHYRFMVLVVVVAMLLTAALPAMAAPNVPGEVTTVTVTSPKTAPDQTCVKAGGTFTTEYATDGAGNGSAQYWLGGTISLGGEALALPATKTAVLTVPAGTADARYDFAVWAKNEGQAEWVAGTVLDSVIVDSAAPSVAAGAITAPKGGDYLQFGVPVDITWNPDAVKDTNLLGVTLQLWVNGAMHSTIVSNADNSGVYNWTPNVVSTNAVIRLVANDCAGASASDQTGAFTIWNADNTIPAVAVTAPAPNANTWIGASYTLKADASDDESGITKVEFFYSTDGVTWKSAGVDTTGPAPYTVTWKPSGIADGSKVWIKATATNGAGAFNSAMSPVEPNWAKVDVTAPAVTLTVPAEGAWISNAGGNFKLVATASDAGSATDPNDAKTGIQKVDFWFSKDGKDFGAAAFCTDTTAPFECVWTDAGYNGPAWFKAVATNNAGGVAHDVNAVTVDSVLPAGTPDLTKPDGGEGWLIGSTQTIEWKKGLVTDANLLTNPVTLKLSSDGGLTWDVIASGLADTGSYAWKVGGLPSNNSLIWIGYADKAGNVVSDMSLGVFTIFGQDSTPPSVAVTAPTANSWVKAAVKVVASATDAESAIASVKFEISTATPDAWSELALVGKAPWETTYTPPAGWSGPVKVRAIATNGMGLVTTSAVVTFYVDTQYPMVSFDQPFAGWTVSGNPYNLIAAVSDGTGSGIKSVAFYVGEQGKACGDPTMKWTALGTATGLPFQVSWNSASVPDGNYCLKAVATDNQGWQTTTMQVNPVDNVYQVGLQAGWNLISSPVLPYNTDIKSVMAGLTAHGSVKQVATFVWSGGKLVQQTWLPSAGGTLKTFHDGQGYWVEMTKADTLSITGRVLSAPPSVLPSYGVSAGWNLIGYTARDVWSGEWAGSYLGSVWDTTQQLYSYNASGDYYVARSDMFPGEGFWLATSAPGTIYP
jgi:hypothetical protein